MFLVDIRILTIILALIMRKPMTLILYVMEISRHQSILLIGVILVQP